MPVAHAIASSYFLKTAKPASIDMILSWHERFGHRDIRDVCAILGVPVPTRMPQCIGCIKGKHKRRALRGGDGPIHEAPRPGYAFAWDHAGPFPIRTWAGHHMISLKQDLFSGRLFPVMTSSTATCTAEWEAHVRQLDAEAGTPVVARMITDSAPYFANNRLKHFNAGRGIVHVQSPPYTQGLR